MKYAIVGITALLFGIVIGIWVGASIVQTESAPQPNYCMELTQGQMPEACK